MILVLGSPNYCNPFRKHGETQGYTPTADDVDMIVFCGGVDVDPGIYGEERHRFTSTPDKERDRRETAWFVEACRQGIPMVGICRGAQFLNVMNGGRLVQHVTNHNQRHNIVTKDGEELPVNSTHHQMMVPNYQRGSVLAWAEGISDTYESGPNAEKPKLRTLKVTGKVQEPEAVWYPETQSLCVQWHPEQLHEREPGYQFFQQLMEEYVL